MIKKHKEKVFPRQRFTRQRIRGHRRNSQLIYGGQHCNDYRIEKRTSKPIGNIGENNFVCLEMKLRRPKTEPMPIDFQIRHKGFHQNIPERIQHSKRNYNQKKDICRIKKSLAYRRFYFIRFFHVHLQYSPSPPQSFIILFAVSMIVTLMIFANMDTAVPKENNPFPIP